MIISPNELNFLVKGNYDRHFVEQGLWAAAQVRLEGIPFAKRVRAEEE